MYKSGPLNQILTEEEIELFAKMYETGLNEIWNFVKDVKTINE